MILAREQVVPFYETLLAQHPDAPEQASNWISLLPPNLCRALLTGRGVAAATKSIEAAFAGSVGARLDSVGGVRMCSEGFSRTLFSRLELAGHTPLEVPGLGAWIIEAAALLRKIDDGVMRFTEDWCSLVLWVAPIFEDEPALLLTSVAMPMLPHCTILSVKSLRHIPAKHVYEGASLYALAENLYHEALHQQLSATLIFGRPLSLKRESTVIQIPWRDAEWKIDRVLHAAWVYKNLQQLRVNALAAHCLVATEEYFVESAFRESQTKLDFLRHALSDHLPILSEEAREIANDVLTC